MYRSRGLPQQPNSMAEFTIPEPLMYTERGTLFVQCIDQESGMVILSSPEQLLQMSRSECIFMDGTFKTTPRLWNQLYLIKGQVRPGVYLLFAGVLLKRKTASEYSRMMRKIKTLIMENYGVVMSPAMIMSDFETGLISAIRQEFPHTHHRGCYFHFCNSLFRYINNNNMKG